MTCVTDSIEERDVSTVDIPGSFMQVEIEGETIHLKLEGKMVDILNRLDTSLYSKYVTKRKESNSYTLS